MNLLPVAILTSFLPTGIQGPVTTRVDDQLTVQWYRRTATANPLGFVFEDAQATYGDTVLTCDRLTVYLAPNNKHLTAEGHVHLLDIDGTADADRIDIDWLNRIGSAQGLEIDVHGFIVRAQTAVIGKDQYELENVYATPCGGEDTTILAIRAQKAVVDPNGSARIYRPSIYLLDKHVLTLKEYDISQGRRATGQPLPSLSYSKSQGFSGGWFPGLLLNSTTAVNGSLHLGQRAVPSEDLYLSKSLYSASQAPGDFVPYGDFGQRFGWAYFENVFIRTPAEEKAFTSTKELSASVGTAWNETPIARRANIAFDKPVDLVLETANDVDHFGVYGQLRAQELRQRFGPTEHRFELNASLAAPQFALSKGLYTDMRLDGFGTVGDARPFGWTHLQAGLVAKPNRYLRLGLAYMASVEFGTPLFETDELYKLHSINLRADISIGPHDLSFLMKYDPVGRRWYDTEIELGQMVRCFEPYVVYRQFPAGFLVGIRFRLDNVVDALRRRGALKGGPVNPPDR